MVAARLTARETALLLYAVSLAAIAVVAPRLPVYWDSWGYIHQAVTGHVGGLGFGRPVFALVSHAAAELWLAVGGSIWAVEALLRVLAASVSAAAAPIVWRLALACGLGAHAAMFAAVAVAASPAVAHVGSVVLTDGAAATLLAAALLASVRAREATSLRPPVVAGVWLGLAIGVREQSIVNALAAIVIVATGSPVGRGRRVLGLIISCACVVALPMLFVFATQPGYAETIRNWFAGMAQDRAMKTFTASDALTYGGWLLSLGPVAVVAAVTAIANRRSPVWELRSPASALALVSLAQLLMMAAFRGISYSPRFLVPGFVCGLSIAGGWALGRWSRDSRRRWLVAMSALVFPLLLAAPFIRAGGARTAAVVEDVLGDLDALPANAVVVTGFVCPAIPVIRDFTRQSEAWTIPPDWSTVCPGWSWPRDLDSHLNEIRATGRPIVIDLREEHWTGAEQRASLEQAQGYVSRVGYPLPRGVHVWQPLSR